LYSEDFEAISRKVRSDSDWGCQRCGINLSVSADRRWLHVHHKNGLKHDNNREILKPSVLAVMQKNPITDISKTTLITTNIQGQRIFLNLPNRVTMFGVSLALTSITEPNKSVKGTRRPLAVSFRFRSGAPLTVTLNARFREDQSYTEIL
jgi:hypothetical protein